jgi:hypothetical protein
MSNPKKTHTKKEAKSKRDSFIKMFINRGNERDVAWLAFVMFAVGVLFMGLHNDLAFKIGGVFGIVVGFLAFFLKLKM